MLDCQGLRDGSNAGCMYLVQARDDKIHESIDGIVQLRLLLVEPTMASAVIASARLGS
ncbi:MAG: hypothetical protein JF606_13295 [Burkholderiales bacterium]|nr:hypothetical protein [Burkholderiales bacterium]